jgi:DNA/RNA-binding domain of Phe-tRNA-synthetase-like protein
MLSIEGDLPIKLALLFVNNIHVTNEKIAYEKLLETARRFKDRYAHTAIGDIPGVQDARVLFRAIGIDPTKYRPASEALLNRALKDKEFYSINTLVDIGNWCSLDFLLPICVYDADKLNGPITVRKGKDNESYLGHNNRPVNLAGRYLMADHNGPFGSPMTDSRHTAITLATRNALLAIYAPSQVDNSVLRQKLEVFVERVYQICAGEVSTQEIVG